MLKDTLDFTLGRKAETAGFRDYKTLQKEEKLAKKKVSRMRFDPDMLKPSTPCINVVREQI